VILDLPRFVAAERPYWEELQAVLDRRAVDPEARLEIKDIERFHYLYERCSSDLARLDSFSEPGLRAFLEALVARAYSEIHESRSGRARFSWREWLVAFPRAFRRHLAAFQLTVAITLIGCLFGGFAVRTDPQAKAVIMPFQELTGSPRERVAKEEKAHTDRMKNYKARFSAELMTHNIRVTLLALAAGLTWGVGTVIMLFYNGVILGAVAVDYIGAGQGVFLTGWLLPHGSVEILAILLGGQGGLVLAAALIGWGDRRTRAERFRAVAGDVFTIAAGAAAMLVWAGIVESFISQYHQPVLPYSLKIALGVAESIALWLYLGRAGRK
jgi:uncharacterized membrane protein SpoIIM required for sporulation